jgi:hypothetical protein
MCFPKPHSFESASLSHVDYEQKPVILNLMIITPIMGAFMRRMVCLLAITACYLSFSPLHVAFAFSTDGTNSSIYGYDPLIQAEQQGSFDRESCEEDCRSRYGLTPYELQHWGRGGGSRGWYNLYAECIQKCNARFWKEVDRNVRELEKETK